MFLPTKSNEKNDLLLKMSKSTDGYVYDSTDMFISQQGSSKQEKKTKKNIQVFYFHQCVDACLIMVYRV
jgi:hypothetical protein